MTMLDVLNRIANTPPEEFVAPVGDARQSEMLTMSGGVPRKYQILDTPPGWWTLKPGQHTAHRVGPANTGKMLDYLASLPKFLVYALWRTSETAWVVQPYSWADAKQRGWNGEPRVVHLVRESIEPLDALLVRASGSTLWYDEVASRRLERGRGYDLAKSTTDLHILSLRRLEQERQEEEERQAREQARKAQEQTVEGRFKKSLEFMGASLTSYKEFGRGYEVVWRHPDGHEYRTLVGRENVIQSAGFCLNGTDGQHTLTSLVKVMEEAQQERRFDIHRAYAGGQEESTYEDDPDYDD